MADDPMNEAAATAVGATDFKPRKERASMTDDEASKPTLFKLPPEIRNRIYRYALLKPSNKSSKRITRWDSDKDHLVCVSATQYCRLPGIIRASRQLRSETRQIFCEENNFMVTIWNTKPPRNEHWSWHLGGVKTAEVFYDGCPSRPDFKRWLFRYWSDTSTPRLYESQSSSDGHGGQYQRCATAFDVIDQLSNSSWETVKAVLKLFENAGKYEGVVGWADKDDICNEQWERYDDARNGHHVNSDEEIDEDFWCDGRHDGVDLRFVPVGSHEFEDDDSLG